MTTPRTAIGALAASPWTPPALLCALVTSVPTSRPLVAANPSLPPDARAELTDTRDQRIRKGLVSNPAVPAGQVAQWLRQWQDNHPPVWREAFDRADDGSLAALTLALPVKPWRHALLLSLPALPADVQVEAAINVLRLRAGGWARNKRVHPKLTVPERKAVLGVAARHRQHVGTLLENCSDDTVRSALLKLAPRDPDATASTRPSGPALVAAADDQQGVLAALAQDPRPHTWVAAAATCHITWDQLADTVQGRLRYLRGNQARALATAVLDNTDTPESLRRAATLAMATTALGEQAAHSLFRTLKDEQLLLDVAAVATSSELIELLAGARITWPQQPLDRLCDQLTRWRPADVEPAWFYSPSAQNSRHAYLALLTRPLSDTQADSVQSTLLATLPTATPEAWWPDVSGSFATDPERLAPVMAAARRLGSARRDGVSPLEKVAKIAPRHLTDPALLSHPVGVDSVAEVFTELCSVVSGGHEGMLRTAVRVLDALDGALAQVDSMAALTDVLAAAVGDPAATGTSPAHRSVRGSSGR